MTAPRSSHTPRPPRHAARPAAALAALLAAALPAVPATAQHAGHQGGPHGTPAPPVIAPGAARAAHDGHGEHAAPAPPADSAIVTRRVVQSGVALDFSFAPVAREAGKPADVVADRDAILTLRLSDAKTGAPMPGLELAGWIDRRAAGTPTGAAACRQKVEGYLQSKVYMEGTFKTRANADLNAYFVLSLNRTPDIAVIDPFLGFGRTKLYKTVPLQSPGEDWVLAADGRRLFVTMPQAGGVAVVGTDDWKMVATVVAGTAPTRAVLQPDGQRLWVTNDVAPGQPGQSGVTVIDATTLKVTASIPTGAGAHAVAFSADGRLAFVTSREAGTLTVIDVPALTKVQELATGARPSDVAFSVTGDAAFVVHEKEGLLAVVSAKTLDVSARLTLAPGARAVGFAPAHAGGHGHAAPAGAQNEKHRWAFVTNPQAKSVHIVDARTNAVLRTMKFEHTPDEVSFTTAFAYVRFSDSPEVSLVSLDDPMTGGFGTMDKFEAGQAAPGGLALPGVSDGIAQAPDMPDAVYVLNAAERMIYYYHYMEGMPIPSGGLTTYRYEPKSILVAGKALRENEPGAYAATVKLPESGAYDFVLLVPDPRVIQCFDIAVAADTTRPAPRPSLALVAEGAGGATLKVGANVLRFRVVDRATREPRSSLGEVRVFATSPGGWRQWATAREVGGGLYEIDLAIPASGVYYLSLAVPSLQVQVRDDPPAILRALSGSTTSTSK